MNIVTGSISELLPSFRQFSAARFLLLFVGGAPNDRARLSGILDASETLNLLSGDHIDIFFFYDGQESLLKFHDEPHTIELLPGSRFGSYEEPLFDSNDFTVVNVTDTDVRRFNRDIVSATISAGSEVADFFGLDTNDLPCLVVSTGYPDESFAIPTFGLEDVPVILRLIKDVAGLRLPELSTDVPKLIDPTERIQKHELAIKPCQDAINRRLNSLRAKGDPEIDKALDKISDQVMTILSERTPMESSDRDRLMTVLSALAVSQPTVKGLQKSITGLEVHKQCIRNLALNYEAATSGLQEKLAAIESSRLTISSFEDELSELADRYQSKFKWKSRIQTLTSWMKRVLGTAKAIKDLADTEKAVERLLSDSSSTPPKP